MYHVKWLSECLFMLQKEMDVSGYCPHPSCAVSLNKLLRLNTIKLP